MLNIDTPAYFSATAGIEVIAADVMVSFNESPKIIGTALLKSPSLHIFIVVDVVSEDGGQTYTALNQSAGISRQYHAFVAYDKRRSVTE